MRRKKSIGISLAPPLAARWLIDHDFEMPTDAEIKELVAEANRKVLEAWGEIYALAVLKWLDGQ